MEPILKLETMARYEYLCKLTTDIEREVMKDRKNVTQFSLNKLINELLEKHYKLQHDTK